MQFIQLFVMMIHDNQIGCSTFRKFRKFSEIFGNFSTLDWILKDNGNMDRLMGR